MNRIVATVLAVPALVLACLVPALPARAVDTGATVSPSSLLGELPVAADSASGYDRSLFQHWIDADANGCDTRAEVLIAESTTPMSVGAGCALTGGTWYSPYDQETWTVAGDVDIDHLVPLAEAWRSGAWSWTADQRRDYANDLDVAFSLIAVTDNVNQSKGDRDPAAWMPPSTGYACQYVSDWILVKYRWSLAVDTAERAAVSDALANCGDATAVVPPVRTDIQPAPAPGAGGGANEVGTGTVRLQGADRYSTAVQISNHFNPGVATVYVATGTNYPDALSASAVAAAHEVPLLLVLPDRVPAQVDVELQRLQPGRIVIAGGPTSVSPAVEARLEMIAPVQRIQGVDRFETSRLLAEDAGLSGSTTYLANGNTFPDALSSAAAAGSRDGGVLLVNGPAPYLDAPTRSTLDRIGTSTVRIAGSSASVSSGIEDSLRAYYPTVHRHGGADRFETGVLVNSAGFPSASTVFLADGTNYPDALAGGALAGALDAPMFIVQKTCVPKVVRDRILAYSPQNIVLLGSTASLSAGVASLTECAPPPPPAPEPPTTPNPPTTPQPPTYPGAVTAGAFCAQANAGWIGYTSTGRKMMCMPSTTDSRLRWRAI